MHIRGVTTAVAAFLLGATIAEAQNVRDIPAPRETPPASFRGAQYVDSRGCVFVRAGVDGQVIWVPRVSANRKVLCGYQPTLTAMAGSGAPVAADAPKASTASAAPAAAKAASPSSVQPKAAATARAATPPRGDYVAAPGPGSAPGTLRCPARAPVAARVALQGGGSIVLCLSRDGLLNERASVAAISGATPVPAMQAGARTVLVCPRGAPTATRLPMAGGGATLLCTPGDGSLATLAMPKRRTTAAPVVARAAPQPAPPPAHLLVPVVPKGYKLAWKDDRLNPNRARGTAAGQSQQDLVWTREVPANLVSRKERQAMLAGSEIRVSTKGKTAHGAHYVQVGSFAQPANAAQAGQRLAALGFPVAQQVSSQGGRHLKTILVGPFETVNDASAALGVARRAGFPDAILR